MGKHKCEASYHIVGIIRVIRLRKVQLVEHPVCMVKPRKTYYSPTAI